MEFIFCRSDILHQETLSAEATVTYSGVKAGHTFQEFSQWFALNCLLGWVIKYPATSHPV